jgi:hypothetical protein
MSAESVATWVLACCTRPRIEIELVPVHAALGGRAVVVSGIFARGDLACCRRFRSAEEDSRHVLMLVAALVLAGIDAVEAFGFAEMAWRSLGARAVAVAGIAAR